MNLWVIISGISAIASLLLIFFDTKEKKYISLKKYIFLLSIVCFVVFGINLLVDKLSGEGIKSKDKSNSSDGVASSVAFKKKTESGEIYAEPTEEKLADENSTDEEEETDSDKKILEIDSITYNTYSAGVIDESPFEIQPNDIIKFSGEITNEGQSNDYEYFPPITGMYRFEFSNVPNGTDLTMRLYNSGWEGIEAKFDIDNGYGITEFLTAGEKYYISVEQYRAYGPYTLNIGQKKEIYDITNYTAVYDSIQYTDQENDYLYVPENDGTYRFEFSDVPNGTDLTMRLYNSGWEQIEAKFDIDNGYGITEFLTAGEIYYIRVEQYREVGAYTLNIGSKKEIVDLTNYTAISDSIQYTAQVNDYLYVPENDGTYRFEFSDVPNGTDLTMRLYNSGWEQIEAKFDIDNGYGITEFLTAGEKYYISVEQYRAYGPYTLNIGQKKEIYDITNYTGVSDSIQYTDQENDYLFAAKSEGTYIFKFSNVTGGNSFRLGVFNSGWEQIKWDYNLGDGGVMEVPLSAGESYFIRVSHYDGNGNYILNVERQ